MIATSLNDSVIFRDIVRHRGHVPPGRTRIGPKRYLDIEAGLVRAQARLGVIYGTRRVGETGALIAAAAATAAPVVDPVGRISN